MKKIISSLLLSVCYFSLIGQSQRQIDTWFFGIPLKEEPKVIHEQLKMDTRIASMLSREVIGGTRFPGIGYLFGGRVSTPVKLNNVSVDSLKVEQTYGVLNESKNGKYIGKSNAIIIHYFISDTLLLRRAYELAIRDLTNGIKKRDVYKKKSSLMEGLDEGYFFYFQNRKMFKKGEVDMKPLSENGGVLSITYSASTK